MYEDFATIYDLLMDDIEYGAWAAYYLQLANLPPGTRASICDCGCGTGTMAIEWARAGHTVTGIDQSESMLRVAAEKARAAGVRLTLTRQDMRRLTLHRPADAIFSACDGVNYLRTPTDAAAFFQSAHRQLKPGGALVFDISTAYKLEHELGDGFYGEDRGDIAYLWQNRWDGASKTVEMDLTFFTKQQGGLYRRFDERHIQRAHQIDELMGALKAAGFDSIRVYGDRTFTPPAPDALRAHIAARKPPNE